MNNFKADSDKLREKDQSAIKRVLDSGWYILGKELLHFESMWAQTCGVPHAVGVGNGMDAIEIGLRALGIGPGDEVITTTMTAFATVLAIIRSGATPVLADIEVGTGLLCRTSVKKYITKKTRAILLVHLYGQVRYMNEWVEICKRHGIYLLEDCAQAHLAQCDGKFAGNFGEWGAYSFYPTKNLGALGDAGALITNRNDVSANSRMLRNYGQSERYHHPMLGLNSRLDELQAALLSVRLDYLAINTERRQKIAEIYFENFKNKNLQLLEKPPQIQNHVYHLFVVLCKSRSQLLDHLHFKGVEALIHYPIPIHKQAPCAGLATSSNDLKNSENHANMCLSIPCSPYLSDAEIEEIIDAVNCFRPQ